MGNDTFWCKMEITRYELNYGYTTFWKKMRSMTYDLVQEIARFEEKWK